MKVHNKIGFHVGPGGNPTGIGDWMRQLDAAGIPFFLKSVDNYGPLFEGASYARASGVAHTLIYRLSTFGQGDGFQYDVPAYHLSPAEAADRHWQKTLAKLPPEFDKDLVWVEPINEVDKGQSDWLGQFAAEIGLLALRDGYKVTLLGWSSGEPEPEHWQTDGMHRYLTMCAQHPERLAISLHEYSYETGNIRAEWPHKIGRFQFLFFACDEMNLARPTVHITEWGWTHEEVPEPAAALVDINDIAALYAQHPQIKGAAIWYLGAKFGGIAHLAQKLIAPVTAYTLTTTFEVEEQPAADSCLARAREPYNREYWVLPQDVTIDETMAAFEEAYPHRVTLGFSYDDAGIGCGLRSKRAVLFGIPEPQYRSFSAWYGQHYQDTNLQFRPLIGSLARVGATDLPAASQADLAAGCDARARVPYNREYWVLPQEATLPQALAVLELAYPGRITIGFSYDDAGVGCGLGNKKAVLFGITTGRQQEFRNWFATHYPDTTLEFRPLPDEPPPPDPPPAGYALCGLHAGADSGDISEAEFAEFRDTRPDVIKVLSSHAGPSVGRLAAEHPAAVFVVRAFLDFGGRYITPDKFIEDTLSDVQRTLQAIGPNRAIRVEIHNEPNLVPEGLGVSWLTGANFNTWFLEVLAKFRQHLPGVKFLFPGLSPGHPVPNFRQYYQTFLYQCQPAVAAADGLAIHTYWNTLPGSPYSMTVALSEVDWYISQFPGKPIWVTEASNNKAGSPTVKGHEYIKYWQELRKRPPVLGVTYFVASGSNPDFQEEVWVGRGIGKIVGNR